MSPWCPLPFFAFPTASRPSLVPILQRALALLNHRGTQGSGRPTLDLYTVVRSSHELHIWSTALCPRGPLGLSPIVGQRTPPPKGLLRERMLPASEGSPVSGLRRGHTCSVSLPCVLGACLCRAVPCDSCVIQMEHSRGPPGGGGIRTSWATGGWAGCGSTAPPHAELSTCRTPSGSRGGSEQLCRAKGPC